jgi:hypothetical protein
MLTHLVTPSVLVPFDAVLESVRERVGIDSHRTSFSLEEWSDLGKLDAYVLCQPEEVVEISALHALDDAA